MVEFKVGDTVKVVSSRSDLYGAEGKVLAIDKSGAPHLEPMALVQLDKEAWLYLWRLEKV